MDAPSEPNTSAAVENPVTRQALSVGAAELVAARRDGPRVEPWVRPRREAADMQGPAEAYRLWRDCVWGYIRHLGVPRDLLEDATQDVFIVACRKWLDFEGRSTRKVWLYGIARRVALEHKRHAFHKECNGDFSIVEQTITEAQWATKPLGSPYESAVLNEASRRLEEVMAGLSENHRDVLVLVELEEQSIAEAALVLGLTEKAVERRLSRARAKLERALKHHRARDERGRP